MFADGACCRVGESPFRGDEEIPLMDFLEDADLLDLVVRNDVGQAGAGRGEDAGASLAEGFHQCAVVEFADDSHPDALALQPARQRAVQGTVLAGEE